MSGPRGAPPTTLGALARRHLGAYVAGTACVGVSQLALNRVDWLSKGAIDQLFGAVPSLARGPLLGILALAVVAFCAQVGSHWLIYNAGRDAEYELRGELLHRLHSLGTGFYGKASAGEIMSRASSDLAQVQLLLGFGVLTLLNAALAFASALQVMFGVSWRLALASLVVAPLLVPVTRVLNRRLFQRTRASQDAVGRLTQVVQTNAANMRVVRSLALESRELHRFEDANDAHLAISLALARARGILTMFIGGVIAVGGLVFFWYGGSLLLRGSGSDGISQGEFFAFWLAFEQLFFPMIVLGVGLAVVQRGRAGHARLAEILSVAPEVVDGPDPAPAVTRGALTVKDLGFAYGDRRVLTGVSLEVPPGGSIAIVGRTGSGKSTLAALLARMLPAPRGAIFLDGRDTCDLPLAYVRGAIGYAQQEAFLFSTTVARNIGLSLDDPDSREATAAIRSAAREAQVEPEILALPQRFDTVVGERGVQLSGGQRQRVALARALVRGSSVLVLDDPISAVDARTEGMILGALERQKDKGTLVLVTHHVAAAARCAEIVVLDEGRIVERGTHAALVAAGGLYAAFAEEQSLAEQLESEPEEAPASEPPASCDDPSRAAAAEEVRAFHEEGAIAGSSDARLVLRLVALLRPHARLVFLSMGALVLVTGAALARPLLMGWVIDRAAARDARGLVHAGLLLTAFTLALFGFRFLQTYLLQIGGARAIADLRLRVVRLLQRLPLGTFDRTPVGRLVARATTDIDAVGEIFASGVLNAIGDLLQLAGILAMMLALDWRLALVAFASVPVLGGVVALGRGPWRRASRDIRAWTARLSAVLNEQINGMAVVQAYGRQRAMTAEHDEVSRAYRRANGRAIFYQAALDASLMLVNIVCIASVLLCAAARSGGIHAVGFAILVSFTEYVWQFFAPVSTIAGRYMALQTGLAGAERVFDFLDANGSHAVDDAGPVAAEGPPDEAVCFAGVTFGYGDGSAPVLHDLTLTVKRGERIALVGATGAGKSTVASLALRLYEPQAGTIRVLGKDVRGYSANALRERFSVVPQEVLLFAGTVLSNVGVSDELPDPARARAALAQVGALELFEGRPGGVEAPVGERGANLSAGERQLIAFARAVYRDAPILLLDEATASIDSSTEARLQRALAAVMKGRTALVIAHRLSTIRMLDRIAVFHKGRMVELGSHDELLARSGVYARLHRMQFAGARADARG